MAVSSHANSLLSRHSRLLFLEWPPAEVINPERIILRHGIGLLRLRTHLAVRSLRSHKHAAVRLFLSIGLERTIKTRFGMMGCSDIHLKGFCSIQLLDAGTKTRAWLVSSTHGNGSNLQQPAVRWMQMDRVQPKLRSQSTTHDDSVHRYIHSRDVGRGKLTGQHRQRRCRMGQTYGQIDGAKMTGQTNGAKMPLTVHRLGR